MKSFGLSALTIVFTLNIIWSQSIKNYPNEGDMYHYYDGAFERIKKVLCENGDFKQAVFLAENVYHGDSISYTLFESSIKNYYLLCAQYNRQQITNKYYFNDTSTYLKNYSIHALMNDTIEFLLDSSIFSNYPFKYDFHDPLGKESWSNMFVTKLLATKKGNCHSLAYLYKILADEAGAKCWFALAPNHIYIRNYSDKIGWYNTELTSGSFPADAWIMTTGYVSPQAIRSGLYMDTLSNQQSIALCVLDLAKGYEFQTHNYYDGFILKCCDLVLQYHAVNPMALLLKAETLKKVYLKQQKDKDSRAQATYVEMEGAYITLAKLGYREMSEKMYLKWLKSITGRSNAYKNGK